MEFPLNPSEMEVRDSLRAFASRSIRPLLRGPVDAGGLPPGLREALFSMGLLGARAAGPEPRAGLESILPLVEVSRVSPCLAAALAVHNSLCLRYVRIFGGPSLRSEFLSWTGAGRGLGTWGVGEGDRSLRVTPGDGCWILDGRQLVLTPPSLLDWMIVTASSDESPREDGGTAFVVDRDDPGLTWEADRLDAGADGPPPVSAVFQRARVLETHRLGTPDRAGAEAREVIAAADCALAALCFGVAESALVRCLEAGGRAGRGRPPRRKKAGARLAERLIEMESVRFLIYRAALREGSGGGSGREARDAATSALRLARSAAGEVGELSAGGPETGSFLYDLDQALACIRRWSDLRAF